jgi:hypothetical protein
MVSAAALISSIVLITRENNDLSASLLGVSCFYMLTALLRAIGFTIWCLFLCILFVFQTFLWVCLTFYENDTLDKFNEWSRENDGTASEAVRFLRDHLEPFQISMGILAGMILIAIICIAVRPAMRIIAIRK